MYRYLVKNWVMKCKFFVRGSDCFLTTFLSFALYSISSFMYFFPITRFNSFALMSFCFGTNWKGSLYFGKRFAKKSIDKADRFEKVVNEYLSRNRYVIKNPVHLEQPNKAFVSNIIILREYKEGQYKGVLLIKYSLYFAFFLNYFDSASISKKYHIILEPSWAGFLDLSILAFETLKENVYIMCYEEKDRKLIQGIDSNLVPIEIGPSWFVNHKDFTESDNKDIDVAVVSSWSYFKNYEEIFIAFQKVSKQVESFSAVIIGYKGDLGKSVVLRLIEKYNLKDNITVLDTIPPGEVSTHVARAKCSILWSKFEGNNRSIIESMFCGTPVIMRKGHNFGEHYSYINDKTGFFSTNNSLPADIISLINKDRCFSPREYVMGNMTYSHAAEKINRVLSDTNPAEVDNRGVALKVNYLRGMEYVDVSRTMFAHSYQEIHDLISKR